MNSFTFNVRRNGKSQEITVVGDPTDTSFEVAESEALEEYAILEEDFKTPVMVIDVGSGYGEFTLQAMALGASSAICFEPKSEEFGIIIARRT
jgi:predicted RNA methylase